MAKEESYSKNLFTAKNLIIYLIVGGLLYAVIYFVFFAKKGGYESIYQQQGANTSSTPPASKETVVKLESLNDASIDGTATLTEIDGKTKVVLALSGSPAFGNHPAHIHAGSCPTPGDVLYPLTNVGGDGTSESVVDVTLEKLKQGLPMAINVHSSPEDIKNYLSCGDLKL